MPVRNKAKVFDKDYKIQPGMDDAQRKKDSKVWNVDPAFLSGAKFHDLGEMGGPQVGPGADADAMGEDTHARITYPGKGK